MITDVITLIKLCKLKKIGIELDSLSPIVVNAHFMCVDAFGGFLP